jgi:hypothetical protein
MSEVKYESGAIAIANQIVDEMQDDILAPFNSGVYFSKYDLLGIAEQFGATKRMNDRKKILKEIFRYVDTMEDLKRLLGLFVQKIEDDIAMFKEIEASYKHSGDVTAEWTLKGEALKAKFNDMMESC